MDNVATWSFSWSNTQTDDRVFILELDFNSMTTPTQPHDPIEGMKTEKLAEDIFTHNLITKSEVKERLDALLHEAYSLGEKKGEQTGREAGVREAINITAKIEENHWCPSSECCADTIKSSLTKLLSLHE